MATLWLQSQYLCSLWDVKNKSFINMSHILFFKINLWYKLSHHFLIIKLKQIHPHLTSLSRSPVFLLGAFLFSKVFQNHFLWSASAQHKKGGPFKSAHLAIKVAVVQLSILWCHHGDQYQPGLTKPYYLWLLWIRKWLLILIALFLKNACRLNSFSCQTLQGNLYCWY